MTENGLIDVFDSTEPFGRELRVARLTADELVAGCPLYLPDTRHLTPETYFGQKPGDRLYARGPFLRLPFRPCHFLQHGTDRGRIVFSITIG